MRLCNCGNKITRQITIDGKKRNLSNRSRCLDCRPFGLRLPKESLDVARKKKSDYNHRLYLRHKDSYGRSKVNVIRNRRRSAVLSLVANTCQFCGYSKCSNNLSFHHVRDKKIELSKPAFTGSYAAVISELKKCVVACHNCHGEIHAGLIDDCTVADANTRFSELLVRIVDW